MTAIENLNRGHFEQYLNQSFEVLPKDMEKIAIELVSVEGREGGQTESFSLLFRGGRERVFRHDTYRIQHPGLGEFERVLGPLTPGRDDGVYYQAVFNRIRR